MKGNVSAKEKFELRAGGTVEGELSAPKVAMAEGSTFNGKIVPGAQAEFFGSYLNIIQPEYVDWTEDQEQYPFVMVAQGGWELTTSVTPPEGFVPDEPTLSAAVV